MGSLNFMLPWNWMAYTPREKNGEGSSYPVRVVFEWVVGWEGA